jgi:hypothetical protein
MTHKQHVALLKIGVVVLVVTGLTVPRPVRALHTLLAFQSALEALWAVDPTMEPPPDNGSRDFAVGGFQGPDGNNFGFSAHSGPSGEDPRGHLSETIPGFGQARFRVTCLKVFGNQAALGLVPTDAASNDVDSEFVLSVKDSGLPGGAGDLFAFIQRPAANCRTYVNAAVFPITRGNLVVHDVLGP